MVGPDPDHPVPAVLDSTPEISAAYDNADLYTQLYTALDNVAHLADHIKIKPSGRVPGQSLAADLQQHTFILRIFHPNSLLACFFKLRSFLF